jgi:uncharacterized protein (DUF2336 family)
MSHPPTYEEARLRAASPDAELRRRLAEETDVPREILFYLCSDAQVAVRQAVAANPVTPAKGNLLLAQDPVPDVRLALAGKIAHAGRSVGVSADQARADEVMRQALLSMAGDPLVGVRAAAAQALKDAEDVDADVVMRLAADGDIVVAQPVLEHSPLLTDAFLLDLVQSRPIAGVLAAIARRSYVDPRITRAIVASRDKPAVAHLLRNAHANLQEDTLDVLVANAAGEPSWQEPLVFRPELSEAALERVIDMVSSSVLDRILSRADLPPEKAAQITRAIGDSLRRPERTESADQPARDAELVAEARDRQAAGQLDEMTLLACLLTDRQDEVMAGLAVLAGLPVPTVRDIALSQSAPALTALAWAAGLSAAFAVELQLRLGLVPVDAVRQPAPDGAFTLDPAEMTWQLDMFRAV